MSIKIKIEVPSVVDAKKSVWNYSRADWVLLKDDLTETSWEFLKQDDPTVGAKQLTSIILGLAAKSIGKREITEKKSSHPWLNNRTDKAIAKRDLAEGEMEKDAYKEFSQIMQEERVAYIAKTRLELKKLKPSSKQWPSKSNTLM